MHVAVNDCPGAKELVNGLQLMVSAAVTVIVMDLFDDLLVLSVTVTLKV